MQQTVDREVLERDLAEFLDIARTPDYCPNGLQVEGNRNIQRIVAGVTASRALIELAIQEGAQAILVHHGLMWKGDPQVIRGFRKERLELALSAGLNVFAYHLPLDKHPEVGNNIQLGRMLGWPSERTVGDKGLVHVGTLQQPQRLGDVAAVVEAALGRQPDIQGANDPDRLIRTVAWCTGGAPGYVEDAALAGADLYLTGELSEPAVHVARETGVSLIGAGHHATERCGVQALGAWIAQRYGVSVVFHDLFVTV
ncbi:Nif3-like dinuclear metal center hexameric protein [Limnobacter humi]|uniref:Nif3-like dinuclear metal center hexameric protein n=1 Tax=Limnobacter humi TaxID=1778671 RepID=A0ABT1WIZ1_9BURK|nr:Nif3-like dinuclear metal center hexameric protein [Limnobacter humi]